MMSLSCTVILALIVGASSFMGRLRFSLAPRIDRRTSAQSSLSMVFDFLKKRSEEGLYQIQNLANKAVVGKLGEALQETSAYVRYRNKVDADNLRKLTDGLSRSRDRLINALSGALGDETSTLEARLSNLEEVLLQADIGSTTTSTIITDLRSYAESNNLIQMDDILPVLRARLIEALTPPPGVVKGITYSQVEVGKESTAPREPTVIFVIGANGMGKTTTIGKIAGRLRSEGNLTVLLGACDTFRAAAVEQLNEWAIRANVSIEVPLPQERGGDPVPVVTRSVNRALDEKFDVLIIDTSGRLSNNFELTQQLQDMKAAIQKVIPNAPHETLLVVDGSMGRNAVEQAAAWRKYVGVSGLAITKLDGTARGGFVVSVVRDLGLPIKFIGVGEKIDDLRDFDPETFVDALLGNDQAKAISLREKAEKMLSVVGQGAKGLGSDGAAAGTITSQNDAQLRLKASFSARTTGETLEGEDKARKRKPRAKPQQKKK